MPAIIARPLHFLSNVCDQDGAHDNCHWRHLFAVSGQQPASEPYPAGASRETAMRSMGLLIVLHLMHSPQAPGMLMKMMIGNVTPYSRRIQGNRRPEQGERACMSRSGGLYTNVIIVTLLP